MKKRLPENTGYTGYTIFIRDLIVRTKVGITTPEQENSQRIIINIQLEIRSSTPDGPRKHDEVVCYAIIVRKIRALLLKNHINLLETVAEQISNTCFEDKRVARVLVRVEKPDIFTDCAGVGVEIKRDREQIRITEKNSEKRETKSNPYEHKQTSD
ncbi:MAG: dihydroneopterin aldolase [Alphaproteobacteria bacterium]|nr:dihydroneopterin aldolase [Alphaproteobacteria bacterium]